MWQKAAIEHDGNVIGGADITSVLPGDFTLPSDESTQPSLSVIFESLDLFAADDLHEQTQADDNETQQTDTTDPPGIQTYSGMMRFSVEAELEEKKEIHVALTHDLQFVTAHPCIPPPPHDVLRSPTSPSFTIEHSSSVTPPVLSKGTHFPWPIESIGTPGADPP